MTIYVKLDANYEDDPAILEAGEKAELLFIRGLALAKRTLSDGFIADVQLPKFGLSSVKTRAERLRSVGLWVRDDDQGGYWIAGWSKWNRSRSEVEEIRNKRVEAGRRGGKRSGEARREANPKQSASANGKQPSNPETETETETTTSSDVPSDPDVSEEARALTREFARAVKANGHGIPQQGSKARDTWLVEMDRLLRLGPPGEGGHVPGVDEVRKVIGFVTSDTFEMANVRSVPKLRERYSALRLKALNGTRQDPTQQRRSVNSGMYQEFDPDRAEREARELERRLGIA